MYDVVWIKEEKLTKVPADAYWTQLNSTLRLAVGTTPLTALTTYAQAHVQLSDPKKKDATERQLELWLKKLETLLLARNDGIESQQQVASLLYNWNFVRAGDGEGWHASSDSDGSGSAQRVSDGLIQHLRMMKRNQQLLDGQTPSLPPQRVWPIIKEWYAPQVKFVEEESHDSGTVSFWRPSDEWDNSIWGLLLINYANQRIQLFLQNGTFYREVRLAGHDGTQSLPTLLPFESPYEDPGLSKKPTPTSTPPIPTTSPPALPPMASDGNHVNDSSKRSLLIKKIPQRAFYISPENDDGDRFTALEPFTYIRRGNLELAVRGVLLDPFSPIPTYSGILLVRELVLPSWTCQRAQANIKAFFHLGPLVVTKHIPPAIAPVRELRFEPPAVLPDVDSTSGVGAVALPGLGNGDWAWLQPFYPASKGAAGAEEEDSNSDETNGELSECSSVSMKRDDFEKDPDDPLRKILERYIHGIASEG
ncbi:hypothetical protein FDENT_10934 [Fusarium denticulatum]|uniref:Uncharacterized protein n=1 Tax=Fusarium denticulatum TaxID=48507 RepID=A0A8H5TFR6_9HYPO|nr:hypothetical protein FDENT_10934 [Fusarium denticulatum]